MVNVTKYLKLSINNYLILLLVITSFPFVIPFIDHSSSLESFLFTLGNVSGFFGLLFFVIDTLLANRILVKYFTPNLIETNRFHKLLGTYGTIFVFLHPLLEMYSYGQSLLFLLIPNFSSIAETHITYGKFAFLLFLIIFTTSTWFRKKIIYRYWLYIHYLTYPITILTFIHITEIGTFFRSNNVIKLHVILLGIIYLINIVHRILTYFNFGKAIYRIKEVKEFGNDIYTIVLEPKFKKVKYTAGQYFYIKTYKYFGEEHPYSLLEYKSNGDLVFGIKAVGNFSKNIKELKLNNEIYIDGPYGVFTREGQNKDPKIIIAGGIGITPFYELIKNYGNEKTYLFYCNRNLHDAINIMEFQQILKENYFNVLDNDNTKGETIINERINFEILKENLPDKILKKANFFICGSPMFITAIQDILKRNKINQDRIFIEAFSL